MALKHDPRLLKQQDQLSTILANIPGVELVAFTPGVQLDGTCDIGSVIESTPHLKQCELFGTKTFCPHRRPMATALTSGPEGPEFERAIRLAVERLREHLAGTDPADFRPLHMPHASNVIIARPVTLDGVPVRVIQTYSCQDQGWLTSFDAHRPARYPS